MQQTAATQPAKISWFVVVDGQVTPRQASMRGQWGYEVKCACGWETKTGGATRNYISGEVRLHKLLDH